MGIKRRCVEMKKEEDRNESELSFRDKLALIEEGVGISVGRKPIAKKDEPPPSNEKDPETYSQNEAGPQGGIR